MKKRISLLFLAAVSVVLISGTIDIQNLLNYSNAPMYGYLQNMFNSSFSIQRKAVANESATLGRVLFYDKQLSSNNTISCASCHKQEFAFGSELQLEPGVNGTTDRHPMRLVNMNATFAAYYQSNLNRFTWDSDFDSLELFVTEPIKNHVEMGYSGTNGDPDMSVLISKLQAIPYYKSLFHMVYGDDVITEERMQQAIGQFVLSIESYDSKYDVGRDLVSHHNDPFPNFTPMEEAGKTLFTQNPIFNGSQRTGGGLGCNFCHGAPVFASRPSTFSNGVLFAAGSNTVLDTFATRSPSLRDLYGPNGQLNGPMMHNGNFTTFQEVMEFYDSIPTLAQFPNLANRFAQQFRTYQFDTKVYNMSQLEIDQIEAFLKTLTGSDFYTNEKWADPFDANGNLVIIGSPLGNQDVKIVEFTTYPNPATTTINVRGDIKGSKLEIFDMGGKQHLRQMATNEQESLDVSHMADGMYFMVIKNEEGKIIGRKKFVKS